VGRKKEAGGTKEKTTDRPSVILQAAAVLGRRQKKRLFHTGRAATGTEKKGGRGRADSDREEGRNHRLMGS